MSTSSANKTSYWTIDVPPGVPFLLRLVIKASLPILALRLAFSALEAFKPEVTVPQYLRWAAYAIVNLLIVTVRRSITDMYNWMAARKLGAVLAPYWMGKLPGSVDFLVWFLHDFETEYLGNAPRIGSEIYGNTHAIRVLWTDQMLTTEPAHVKAILSSDFNSYAKGRALNDLMKSVLGEGVFNSDGELWKFHRSITRPFFTRDRVSDFNKLEAQIMRTINALGDRLREGIPVDFQDAVSRCTLDSTTEFLFGTSIGSLLDPFPYPSSLAKGHEQKNSAALKFSDAFNKAQMTIAVRSRGSMAWPLAEIFEERSRRPMKVIHGVVEPFVKQAMDRKAARKTKGKEKVSTDSEEQAETLLDHLFELTDDPVLLRDEALNLMLAGRDTTASTLTFAVYFLALYPDVFKRLRKEVITSVGKDGDDWRRPTMEDIKEMKYLRAVINEVLRLYPAVPFNMRTSTHATTLPPPKGGSKPIYIPKDQQVVYSVFLMHRRTDLWGPDVLEFDPDRWIDERLHKYVTANPFIFLPFNAGPRICLGQQQAYNHISYMLIRLLQHFDSVDLALDAQPKDSLAPAHWKHMPGVQGREKLFAKAHLTCYLHKGLWVRMHRTDH